MSGLSIQQSLERALQHHRVGRLAEAMTLYEQVLNAAPDNADALHLLGLAKHQSGQTDAGVPLIRRAIQLHPNSPDFHANLGGIFASRHQWQDAVDAMQRASDLKPADTVLQRRLGQYLKHLGAALLDHDRPADAAAALERAVHIRPDAADALGNLGLALAKLKRYPEAITRYEQAIALSPTIPELHTNHGAALLAAGRPDDAAMAHRRALDHRPNWPAAMKNLAIALAQVEQVDEALALHEQVLRNDPDDATSLFNRGLIRLSRGDYAGGWRDYEARVRVPELKGQASFPHARWAGEAPAGRTILVHGEQGLGDMIQFVRYVPNLIAGGAKVIVQCDPLLVRLLRHSFPADAAIVARQDALPSFDAHVPVMSLPHAFGTTLETVPADVPYLRVPDESDSVWRERLKAGGGGNLLRVGLAWSGNAEHYNDHNRSIPLDQILPALARVPNVRLFSLQKGPRADQLAASPLRSEVTDLAPTFDDLADSAAAITRLDVVVCVDTSIAHLAGALGKPVWTLLPRPADFRWMTGRDDSPWYPTMRLFRQTRRQHWDDVVARVASDLASLAAGHVSRRAEPT